MYTQCCVAVGTQWAGLPNELLPNSIVTLHTSLGRLLPKQNGVFPGLVVVGVPEMAVGWWRA